jgi:hypothetical protein
MIGVMKTLPIIFSGSSVRAVLAGTKTQTRRIIPARAIVIAGSKSGGLDPVPGQRFEVGDHAWVREAITWREGFGRAYFDADGKITQVDNWGWKKFRLPAMFMPRGASRIDLAILDVRVERLQDITEEDARAEGAPMEFRTVVMRTDGGPDYRIPHSCRGGFANAWNHINGKRAAWDANPWVWVYEFRRIKP